MRAFLTTLLLAGIALFPCPLLAVMVIGTGSSTSCGAFVVADESTRLRVTGHVWVYGYLSGLAAGTANDILAQPAIDSSAIDMWIDNYCRANPLDSLVTASTKLFNELSERKQAGKR